MAQGDEWEPDEHETGDEDDGTEGAAQDDGGADSPPELTAEEREALAEMRKAGISPKEALKLALAGETTSDPPPRKQKPVDPNRVVTVGEVKQIYAKAREEALGATARAEMTARIDDTIDGDAAFTEAKPGKLRYIRDEVLNRIAEKPENFRLPRSRFLKEVARVTQEVLDEERGGSGGGADEVARRASVAAETGESSRSAGAATSKRAGVSKDQGNGELPDFDFGVGEDKRFPTAEEIDAEHRRDLERFNTAVRQKK